MTSTERWSTVDRDEPGYDDAHVLARIREAHGADFQWRIGATTGRAWHHHGYGYWSLADQMRQQQRSRYLVCVEGCPRCPLCGWPEADRTTPCGCPPRDQGDVAATLPF
jgi:hypothetical protein